MITHGRCCEWYVSHSEIEIVVAERKPCSIPSPTHICHQDPVKRSLTNRRAQIYEVLNTLRLRQNGHHFPDDTFKCIFLNENTRVLILIPLKFGLKDPINNIPAGSGNFLKQWCVVYWRIYASLSLNELSSLHFHFLALTELDKVFLSSKQRNPCRLIRSSSASVDAKHII